jgi:hypothetical protein
MQYGTGIFVDRGRLAIAGLLAICLAACGGGGGGGTPLSGTGSGTTATAGTGTGTGTGTTTPVTPPTVVVATPTMTIAIVDAANNATPSNSISSSTAYARVVLKDATGAAVASKLVTFNTAAAVATLQQASALTDTSGVASVRIDPVNRILANAGTVTAIATVAGTVVQAAVDYQTSAASVSISSFTTGSASVTALQSAAASAKVLVGGSAATSGQVSVSFSASCGSFSPATATSASDGTVSTVYQSIGTCSGPVTLTAQASGATAATTTINVVAAQAANILFTSSDQTSIFTSRASSGVKQATLKFQVVDSSGSGMASQAVQFSLSSTAVAAGVTFSASGSAAAQTVTTDASGFASTTITSGPLPTPVLVTAALVANTAMQASSSTLAVTSGVPVQRAASFGASLNAIEGFSIDGKTTDVTFRISDRQGNPVPAGTAVTFVASHGLVTGSCNLNTASACTVTYTSQGARPTNGHVVVLAFLDGEEAFVDLNGNNTYDTGETFTDTGLVYRDDNENGFRDATEQTYPGGQVGTATCSSALLNTPFVANTCDGIWSSSIRVRKQTTIVLSTSKSLITFNSLTARLLTVVISDLNGNSVPTGSTVAVSIASTGSTCAVASGGTTTVGNSTAPLLLSVALNGDASCTSTSFGVTVTTPSPTSTVSSLTVP